MKHTYYALTAFLATFFSLAMTTSCSEKKSEAAISQTTIEDMEQELLQQQTAGDSSITSRGIRQAAALWTAEDGTEEDFRQLVKEHLCKTAEERQLLFESLSRVMENCFESADKLTVELLRPTQLTNAGEPATPDWIMSGYSPMAHFSDDMFANKLAFITIINFPHYTLEEKNTLGRNWTRLEWAMARMGDVFTTRVPAKVNAQMAQAQADAENYIAGYNIYMGSLRTEDGRQLWPDDKVLLSHWNLRDELKALYAEKDGGQEKQEMIYKVMQRIVRQEIPQAAINSGEYVWKPYSDTDSPEPYTRYERILQTARACFAEDRYCPSAPSAITRNFEEGVEIPATELDSLFRALVGSKETKGVASIIRQRLGRELRPYDIWYNGFSAGTSVNEAALDALTRRLYPDANAFAADMPRLLQNMGFYSEDARNIARHIVVEPARGSGHAWPCLGRNEPARLRTRIPEGGMDYKGYNIAIHEFGHCVEQVLDMYQIDHYMLSGVPNTAYTEASAFLWQQRDKNFLPEVIGTERLFTPERRFLTKPETASSSSEAVLANFWSMYEIMGVSLVDMAMWRWIYANPDATPKQLCEAVVSIAQEVWNEYYEPVLGEHDCVLLAIYSHMVNAPMYLPNYPLGHIVQYQIEEHLAGCQTWRDFASEYARIYRLGRLTPKEWMIQAVGTPPSITPVLNAVAEIIQQQH